MKKCIFIFLGVSCSLGLITTALQSDFAKNLAQKYLQEALAESGFTIEIDQIEGTIPHAVNLRKVEIKSSSIDISVDSVQTRLSLLGLLKKELIFTELNAKGISWELKEGANNPAGVEKGVSITLDVEHFSLSDVEIPGYFPSEFKGVLKLGKRNTNLYLDVTAKRSDIPQDQGRVIVHIGKDGLLRLKGTVDIKAKGTLPFDSQANLQFFARGPWNGTLHGKAFGSWEPSSTPAFLKKWIGNQWQGKTRFQYLPDRSLVFSNLSFSNERLSFQGKAGLKPNGQLEQAALQVESEELSMKIDIVPILENTYHLQLVGADYQAEIDISPFSSPLNIPQFSIRARSLQANGNLSIQNELLNGKVDLSIDNLSDLPFGLYGSLKAETTWMSVSGIQEVSLQGQASEIYWKELFCEDLSFSADLIDPFRQPSGQWGVAASQCKWNELSLNLLSFHTTNTGELWPYQLAAIGRWKHPLALDLSGLWKYEDRQFHLDIETLVGSFYNHPMRLAAPSHLNYAAKQLTLSDFQLSLADAQVRLECEHRENDTSLNLSLMHFPLDMLSLNPLDVSILGTTDCTLAIQQSGLDLSGNLDASIDRLRVVSPDLPSVTSASGKIHAQFQTNQLKLNGALNTPEKNLAQFDVILPVKLNLWPLHLEPVYDQKLQGHLSLDGRIEDVLDFLNLGMHRLEGDCSCNFTLGSTLNHPSVDGFFILKNGRYENYITGMQLMDLNLNGSAKGDQARFHLDALDRNRQGSLKASGKIDLQLADALPFQIDMAVDRLEVVQIDLVSAQIQGNVEIAGNLKSATAKGKIEVIQTNLQIPNHIPRTLPDLVVVYKNASKPPLPQDLSDFTPYPLALDLDVNAPDGIFVEGRGLDSEWKGNFHLGGTYISPTTQGKLQLLKGEFLFSSRAFKLIDGSLSFRGKETEMPTINLAALTQIKDVAITARLKGPLNNPQITLQSVPPLPMSTIMSYLLFGHEIAEINSFQALQLANSLASLAGEGPGVMESTRKALGVDRLEIVSVPTGDDDLSETIAVQVGKYVSEGVLVSFTQGAEDASTNISIEVEMKHGFILQLESDQRQEQGKFTLKWHRNF